MGREKAIDYTACLDEDGRHKLTKARYEAMTEGCFSNANMARSWCPTILLGVALFSAGAAIVLTVPTSTGVALCVVLSLLGFFTCVFGGSLGYVLMERNEYVHDCGVVCCGCTERNRQRLDEIYRRATLHNQGL